MALGSQDVEVGFGGEQVFRGLVGLAEAVRRRRIHQGCRPFHWAARGVTTVKLSFFGDFPVPLKSNVCKNRIHLQCLDGLVIKLDIPMPSVRRDQTFDLSVE